MLYPCISCGAESPVLHVALLIVLHVCTLGISNSPFSANVKHYMRNVHVHVYVAVTNTHTPHQTFSPFLSLSLSLPLSLSLSLSHTQAEVNLAEHKDADVRPVAMATGFLRSYQSMVQVRRQVVAILLSDWSVLCLDHELKLLWKTPPLRNHGEGDNIM